MKTAIVIHFAARGIKRYSLAKNMKNTGVSYELLTKTIFQQLLQQDEVETLELQHNVTFKGKTTSHQIDVYWKFKAGGITYHTIVQAKDWAQTVSQGHVMTFRGVLDDLDFRATGIMVSRLGFQSGAKDYAKGNSIILYELREMTDNDWTGRIKKIQINIRALSPYCKEIFFHSDQKWVDSEFSRLSIPSSEHVTVMGSSKDIEIVSEDGTKQGDMTKIIDLYLPNPLVPMEARKVSHHFPAPVYVPTNHPLLNRLRITGVDMMLGVDSIEEKILIDGGDLVHFILKNVMENTAHIFAKDKSLIK